MYSVGTSFYYKNCGEVVCAVLLELLGEGRFGAQLLTIAHENTAAHLRIFASDLPENLKCEGKDLCIETWQTRVFTAEEIQAIAPESVCAMPRPILERMFREKAKAAARGQYAAAHTPKDFVPNEHAVPVSGKCWTAEEMESLVDASMDFWLTTGRFNVDFEKEFASLLGVHKCLTVNSGSSANLLAIATLCSHKLGEKRLKKGDEVITAAAGFPTTVAPIVQHGLTPVFVDVAPPTYNAIPEQIRAAISPKTKAIFLAHTLGNPFDVQAVMEIARQHDLWVIEDSCDALGSTYSINGESPQLCGSFGHIGTFSFYPAHHITMGEGGAVVCRDQSLYRIALSLRDWGRDCWCAPGTDDSCKNRYKWKFGHLPDGYDHKYVYSHLGYNLKITDMQAAVGLRQLEKLAVFTNQRQKNFRRLYNALLPFEGKQIILPQATSNSDPSWFGFLVTLREDIDRTAVLEELNASKIGTRLLFAGNITRQPCFEGVSYREAAPLIGTDIIMNHTFWLGCYPGLHDEHIDYIAKEFGNILKRY